jgi:hypothetical protein
MAVASEPLEYNRDIRPILAENCFSCHGPDSASRKADLRLDQRELAIEMGAITPDDPDSSAMLERIFADDPDVLMPPPETKKQLSAQQKEMLRQWIARGAEYQLHWSLIAPERPEPPEVKNAAWVQTPIDRFVLARLEEAGLEPAAEADRRTLGRRVSLDLTGLPPDPQSIEAFVNDPSDDAYETYVDQLLASDQWGEHRGRYWLDVARYADTHGIHFDNYREVWAYRDWVIKAFNRNLPFDQFTIEQLAGDLLPDPSLDQQIASGFNRCNITTNEGGIIDEEYAVLYTRDRTETVGQVWMAMTVGCAVCHDHKFDQFSQREFYEMSAYFNNTTQAVRDGNVKDTPPIVMVPLTEDRTRWDALVAEIPSARQAVEARRGEAMPEFESWLASASPEVMKSQFPTEALHLDAPLKEGQGTTARVTIENDSRELALTDSAQWQEGPSNSRALQPQGGVGELPGVGDFDHDQAFTCTVWVMLPSNDSSGAICARMDDQNGFRGWDFWVQRRQVGAHVINQWSDNALKVVAKKQVPANQWTHVAVSYDGSGKASGVKVYYSGQAEATNVEADTLTETTRTDVPFRIGQRRATSILSGAAIQDLRLYKRALEPAEVHTLASASRFAAILSKPADQRSEDEIKSLYGWWLGALDQTFQDRSAQLARLQKEQADIKARGTIAHVMHEAKESPTAYILDRGDYDKRGEQVNAGTPGILPPMPDSLPRNRLGFAQWLLLREQPLTTRVTVNRFWQQLYGQGIVRTPGDFGITGDLPSHPELLDWMAVEFRESGWDVKRFFKLLVTSATYRQSATVTPEKLERDADNRLLSRGPRFRMDAEMVRDYALAASGLLVPEIGGPSLKPYQPEGVWEAVAMIGSNTRNYQQESGDNLYRRSMYTFWKRSAPPASMDIFNAPSREFCTVVRERTNTPLQALVTLNDPQFIEAARALAQRALTQEDASLEARADFLMLHLAARRLEDSERAIVTASLADLLAYYEAHPDDAAELLSVGESKPDENLEPATLAAWTMLTNQLMNLDEVLNK